MFSVTILNISPSRTRRSCRTCAASDAAERGELPRRNSAKLSLATIFS